MAQPSGNGFSIQKLFIGCLAWGALLVVMIGGILLWSAYKEGMFKASVPNPDLTGLIVYAAAYSGNFEIYTSPPEGFLDDRKRLTYDPGSDWHPEWSPDGTRIAFSSDRHGTRGIYIMNADGTDQVLVAESGDEPAWSPDGVQIVFSTDTGLHLIDASGANETELTSDNDFAPDWSPDGTKIIFSRRSAAGFSSHIFMVNPDGTGVAQMTQAEGHSDSPVWSPDGTMIAFVSDRSGQYQLYVMDADGSNLRQLSEDPNYTLVMPSWSPDMQYIIVQTSHETITTPRIGDIHAVYLQTQNLLSVFYGEEEERDPDWSPIP
jgi:Tol biopolymer transport system component